MGPPNWDQLLQQSEDLVMRDSQGFPRVERDILQIEAFSTKLKAATARVDSTSEALAASRLLAQEGLNSQRLTQALAAVDIKPTYEDVFQVCTADLEQYLQQVHQMTVVTAIQEAQRASTASFEEYMTDCLEAQWAAAKRQLFEGAMPYGALTSSPGPSAPSTAITGGSITSADMAKGGGGSAALSGRAERYAAVVHEINDAILQNGQYDAAGHFADVCSDEATGDRRVTLQRIWLLLKSIIHDAIFIPQSQKHARLKAVLRGAGRYLEAGFAAHMTNTIQMNRAQACLGGSPSKLSQVNAYLRVREKDKGALDFDTPGGVDTTWQRIFYCLRAGFQEDAVQCAKGVRDMLPGGGSDFSSQLGEWLRGGSGGGAHDGLQGQLAQECERLLRDRSTLHHVGGTRYKLMVLLMMAGEARLVDSTTKEAMSVLSTIEDFMWFRLALVQTGMSGSASQPAGSSSNFSDDYTLSDLQQYLNQYPSTHYSHNGKEPLLYCMVLLLSLQFHAAISFLARDESCKPYRMDAVHIATALHFHKLLEVGQAGDASDGDKVEIDCGELVHRYGKEFIHARPEVCLEYYMLAAAMMGGSMMSKGTLLRELLVESKAYGFLLGSGDIGGDGGAVSRFVPSAADRLALLEAVAYQCQLNAQLTEAVELYLTANRPRPALSLLNHMIADTIQPAVHDAAAAERYDELVRRGAAAVSCLSNGGSDDSTQEVAAFNQLRTIKELMALEARGDHARALQCACGLSFLPHERPRLQIAVDNVSHMHPAVAKLLPPLLLAAAGAMSALNKSDQLHLVAAFAAAISNRIPHHVYQHITRLDAAMT